MRPGAVLLKYFRDIASADLNALFPDVKVVMGFRDRLMLGVPALIGGVPILLKLASTLTVLFLVAGFYLGLSNAVRDEEMAGALAAVSGLIALGGFMVTQWVRFQRQSLLHQKILSDNVYYRNVNNNAGIFDYIIGEAEERECKEAFLAYCFTTATSDRGRARPAHQCARTFRHRCRAECDDALAPSSQLRLRLATATALSDCRHGRNAVGAARPRHRTIFPFDDKRENRPRSFSRRPTRSATETAMTGSAGRIATTNADGAPSSAGCWIQVHCLPERR